MSECPKCCGKMIQGEAYIDVDVSSTNPAMGGIMSSLPGMNLGGASMSQEKRIKWREKTGEKTGFLIKSEEVRTMSVKGIRCLECGYIELYAKK